MQSKLPAIARQADCPDELLLTTDQAAAWLGGVSRAWLIAARMHGRGPRFVRLARMVRYRVGDLREYVRVRVVETDNSDITPADVYQRDPTQRGIRRIRHRSVEARERARARHEAIEAHNARVAETAAELAKAVGADGESDERAE